MNPAATIPAAGGLTRNEAAALALEVGRAPGYRGEVLRLVGEAPDGDGWAVRARAIVAGGTRLVRSRAAWDAFRAAAQKEIRTVVETAVAPTTMSPTTNGHVSERVEPDPEPEPDVPAAPAPRGSPLERWRAATEAAIADAEAEQARLLARAAQLRAQAAESAQAARVLRRALGLVEGARTEHPRTPRVLTGPTIRSRLRDWARAHSGELVSAAAVEGLGLSVKRITDAAAQLRQEGQLERVGKGHYRLVETESPT